MRRQTQRGNQLNIVLVNFGVTVAQVVEKERLKGCRLKSRSIPVGRVQDTQP